MITGISSFKEKNPKNNTIKQAKFSQYANISMNNIDNKKNVDQITFKGNLAKVGNNILGDALSKISGKTKRLAEEGVKSIARKIRSLKGNEDLPFTDKPIVYKLQTNDKIEAAAKAKAAESALASSKRKISKAEIEASGNTFENGDVDVHGNLTSSGEKKVANPTRANRKHHEDFDNSDDKTSFKGKGEEVSDNINDTKTRNLDDKDIDVNDLSDDGINDIENYSFTSKFKQDTSHFEKLETDVDDLDAFNSNVASSKELELGLDNKIAEIDNDAFFIQTERNGDELSSTIERDYDLDLPEQDFPDPEPDIPIPDFG